MGQFRRRLFIVPVTILVYIILLLGNATLSSVSSHSPQQQWSLWLLMDFSALVAFLFLLIGLFIWFVTIDRRLAFVLLVFCCSTSWTFEVETGASLNNALLTMISDGSSELAIGSLLIFFLLFPRNRFAARDPWSHLLCYASTLLLLLAIGMTVFENIFWRTGIRDEFIGRLGYGFSGLLLVIILILCIDSYLQADSRHMKQQVRLFLGGVFLAIAPFLFLTILPQIVPVWARYQVNSQISTLGTVLIPLTLAYIVLRYQILVYEIFVRRVVVKGGAIIFLSLLAYGTFVLSRILLTVIPFLLPLFTCAFVFLVLISWKGFQTFVEHLFFPQIGFYRNRLTKFLKPVPSETNEAALIITAVAGMLVERLGFVGLFLLDTQTDSYTLYPQSSSKQAAAALLQALSRCAHVELSTAQLVWSPHAKRCLEQTTYPLFAGQVTGERSSGTPSLLAHNWQNTPLLAPVLSGRRLIGVLALMPGHRQSYTAVDCEALMLLAGLSASLLVQAERVRRSQQAAAMLTTFYSMTNLFALSSFSSLAQAAERLASIAVEATGARVAFWLPAETEGESLLIQSGTSSQPFTVELCQKLSSMARQDEWHASSDSPAPGSELPIGFAGGAVFPLMRATQHEPYGFLLFAFAGRRYFFAEERVLLRMFAQFSAASLVAVQAFLAQRKKTMALVEHKHMQEQLLQHARGLLQSLASVQGHLALLDEQPGAASEVREKLQQRVGRTTVAALLQVRELRLMVEVLAGSPLAPESADQVLLPDLLQRISTLCLLTPQFDGRQVQITGETNLLAHAPLSQLELLFWILIHYLLSMTTPSLPLTVELCRQGERILVRISIGADGAYNQARAIDADHLDLSDQQMQTLFIEACTRLTETMGGTFYGHPDGKAIDVFVPAGEGSSTYSDEEQGKRGGAIIES